MASSTHEPDEPAPAGECDIEITPEMIEAGSEVFLSHDPYFAGEVRAALKDAFLTMWQVQKRSAGRSLTSCQTVD